MAVISVGIFFCGALQIGNPSELDAASPKVGIVIRDSDDLVGAGTDVEVEIWVRDADSGKSYTLRFLHAFGGPFVLDGNNLAGTEFAGPVNADGDLGPMVARLVIPLGTAHAEATISAMVDVVEDAEPLPIAIAKLEIGDPGDPIGSAVLRPGREDHAKRGKRISTSLKRSQTAYLELSVENSLGNMANDYDVSSIIIVATQADMGRESDRPSETNRHTMRYGGDDAATNPANALTQFTLRPVSQDASHIDVYAIVIGADGHARSNTLELNFAGVPAGLRAGEPSGNLASAGGTVNIVVTGLDSVGNRTELNPRDVEVEVVAGPEDAELSLIEAERPQQCDPPDPEDEDDEDGPDEEERRRLAAIRALDCEEDQVVVSLTTSSKEAALGHYQVELRLSSIPVPAVTAVEIIAVGHPVFLSLELYRESDPGAKLTFGQGLKGLLFYVPGQGERVELIAAAGEVLIAAVVLRDQFGELVASSDPTVPGDGVTFDAAGSLDMLQLSSREHEIVRGVAVARFLVLGDSGKGLLLASTSELHDVVRVVAAAENVTGLDGLTSIVVGDLTVWTAPNQILASALFPQLASRGAGAIHLWLHGQHSWLSYAPADPAHPDPDTDFPIQSGAIIWISGDRDRPPPAVAPLNPDE
ncbi:MAG: hypothetical protein OXH19_09925 [Chloroflexi bacterium]|nr:hypothetical protein [Chloroflexota bacterium]MCY3588855.1 hypothetical protein [Chloroflexota bacterium]MCY3685714.1 hypothetical protein [Chloroflexota bacterium]MDE2709198.1 hypothetical protein [Chloroflexota bacterium]